MLLRSLITCIIGLNCLCAFSQWPDLSYYAPLKVEFCTGGTVETFYNVNTANLRRYKTHIGKSNAELDVTGDGIVSQADLTFLLSMLPIQQCDDFPSQSCLSWNGTNWTNSCGSVVNIATGCGGISFLPMFYVVELYQDHAVVRTTQYGANNFRFIYVR